MKYILLLLLPLTLTGQATDEPIRMLFVGNSLTYVNDLPSLVQKLAEQQGITVKTEMLAKPNYALEDHWLEGLLQQRIASGSFDFVVVQQGPSSQEEGRNMLLEYGAKIKALCSAHDTKLAFYMVWPSKQNYHTFDGVIKNYREAATANQALLCPVGKAWKAHFDGTNDFSLYDYDGFHPSLKGSQLAAEIILKSLLDEKGE